MDGLYCPKCDTEKPLADFPRKGKHRDNRDRYGYCKPCHSAYQRAQKLANFFNISVDEYDAMLAAQGNACAICGRPPGKMRLAVDHSHTTGQIRGLVCQSCNHGLGYWRDDVARFRAACEYLMPHGGRTAHQMSFALNGADTSPPAVAVVALVIAAPAGRLQAAATYLARTA